MTKSRWFSRRQFLQSAGMTAFAVRAGVLRASVQSTLSKGARIEFPPRFAFVGAMGPTHGIHVYAIDSGPWKLQQIVASQSPVSLALHPTGRWLYVLNGISEYNGLPCGSVESYAVDAESGQLALLGRQMLSLSATMPRHLTIAPDGKNLFVSVHGGGLYNLLPIEDDGRVGRVNGILKETGSGPHARQESAHPQAALFDRTGRRVITSDLGCDRISILSLEDGLRQLARFDMPAGSGPSHIALHPAGHLFYVANSLDGTLSGFAYDANTGSIAGQLLHVRSEHAEAMSMEPAGEFLYTARGGAVTAWHIQNDTGALRRVSERRVTTSVATVPHINAVLDLIPDADGRRLFIVTGAGIHLMEFDPSSGHLSFPDFVASVAGARSMPL